MIKIAIINGPNLNLLGKREPEVYGKKDFDSFLIDLHERYPSVLLNYFQSNIEGEIVTEIQKVGFDHDGIIINAGAYTHTSVAIGDAIAAVPAPSIEVHISNVYAREEFRKINHLTAKCIGVISGMGLYGYEMGIIYFLNKKKNPLSNFFHNLVG